MNKTILLSVIPAFLIFIFSCNLTDSDQQGNIVGAFRAQANLKLPLSVAPRVSTAWRSTDDGFILARGVPGVLRFGGTGGENWICAWSSPFDVIPSPGEPLD